MYQRLQTGVQRVYICRMLLYQVLLRGVTDVLWVCLRGLFSYPSIEVTARCTQVHLNYTEGCSTATHGF